MSLCAGRLVANCSIPCSMSSGDRSVTAKLATEYTDVVPLASVCDDAFPHMLAVVEAAEDHARGDTGLTRSRTELGMVAAGSQSVRSVRTAIACLRG